MNCLVESIKHWEENLELCKAGKDIAISGHDCACCREFFEKNSDCIWCPICDYTGLENCAKTPYSLVEWFNYKTKVDEKNRPNLCNAITAEIVFLKKVLNAQKI